MKASELLIKLQQLVYEHGDIDVYHFDDEYPSTVTPIESVHFKEKKKYYPDTDYIEIS